MHLPIQAESQLTHEHVSSSVHLGNGIVDLLGRRLPPRLLLAALLVVAATERAARISVATPQDVVRRTGLVPIALGGTQSCHNLEHPMAAAILGGLSTSPVVNLFRPLAPHFGFGRRNAAA